MADTRIAHRIRCARGTSHSSRELACRGSRPRARPPVLQRCSRVLSVTPRCVRADTPPAAPPPAPAAHHSPHLSATELAHAAAAAADAAVQRGVQPPLPPAELNAWQQLPPRFRGLILLNLLTLLFGSNVAVVKGAQDELGPWAFSAGRFAIAALAFAPCLPVAFTDAAVRSAGIELGAIASLGYALQAWGLTQTSAGHVAFLGAFTVLLTPLLAGLGGRIIPGRTWGATATAMVGIAILELGSGGGDAAGVSVAGDLSAFAAAAVFAWQILRTEHHIRRLSLGAGSPRALGLVAAQLATLAGCFCAAAALEAALSGDSLPLRNLLEGHVDVKQLPLLSWLYTGVISTAGTLWLELEALRDVSAPDAALVYSTEPVWGALTAVLLLGERWGPSTYAGAALILAGSVVGQIGVEEDAVDGVKTEVKDTPPIDWSDTPGL